MDALHDILILLAGLIWVPLLPLRLLLHTGIPLWRRLGKFSYRLSFIFWVLTNLIVIWKMDFLTALRFDPIPVGDLIGPILLVGGAALTLWTIQVLGMTTFLTKSQVLPEEHPTPVIQKGPFRLIRHPFYLSEWLSLTGLIWMTSSWLALGLFLASVVMSPLITHLEERELVERFGQAYRDYQQRVPKLIPGLRRS